APHAGTVIMIRIWVTVFADFDRKVGILPNKSFVTKRRINCALSDTTTRLVVRLGVAYGSDLAKVKRVLLQAAMEHPKVMHDPEPAVFFTPVGARPLAHGLRPYVREFPARSPCVAALNPALRHPLLASC
ncbi:mechanosensitive ion channel domain-containing protein, partial [Salmonella enterica]|uniref:mechanosensitive ion channel domain-containing protein n=1 Tax=Salmonella enterica TaxID=28901 RepID=UPI00398C5C29